MTTTSPAFKQPKPALWTLRRVLAVAGLIVVATVGSTIWWAAQNYRQFALLTLDSGAANTVMSFVASRVDKVYANRMNSIVNGWARSSAIQDAVNKPDEDSRTAYAGSLFNSIEVKEGLVKLKSVSTFDNDFNLLAQNAHEEKYSLVVTNEDYRNELMTREGRDARVIVGRRFAGQDGTPLFSVVAPVGGLRAVGYIEVVTDPLEELADLGDVLGGKLEVMAKNGEPLLVSTSSSFNDEDGTASGLITPATIDITVTDAFDQDWANIHFTRDITGFVSGLGAVTTNAFIASAGGVVATLLIVTLLMRLAVFRSLNQFADAALSLADGDVNVALPRTGHDEIGRVRSAMELLRAAVSDAFLMKHLVENTPTPTAMIGSSGSVDILNSAARKGLNAENVDDIDPNFLNLPDDVWENLLHGDSRPQSLRVEKDNDIFSVSSAPVHDEHGVFLGSMLAWNDITTSEQAARSAKDLLHDALGVIDAVAQQSTHLQEAAEQLNLQSTNSIERTGKATGIARNASSNSNMVASATQQLTASIEEINRRANEANGVSKNALQKAEDGQQKIDALAEASEQIGAIVQIITDIAHRTRLLALNATIEAQRAGEMGRGFNVVANEVKGLADQTSSATENIASLTGSILSQIRETAEVMSRIREITEGMSDIQSSITGAVEEQHQATEEITVTIGQIAAGSETIASIVSDMNTDAQTTQTTASRIQHSSHELSTSSLKLKSRMNEFQRMFIKEAS